MADNPYAEFQKPSGGRGATPPPDPYAEFGGRATGTSATPHNTSSMTPTTPIGRFVSGMGEAFNPIPGAVNMLTHNPIDTARGIYNAQREQFTKAAEAREKGSPIEAGGYELAGTIPLIGPAAANIGEVIGGTQPKFDKYGNITEEGRAPDIERGLGQTAGMIGGFTTAPAITRGVGRMIAMPSEPLAESALGIRGQTHAYGANPGRAILTETSGIRPATVENSARQALRGINAELESKARASSTPISIQPARDIIAGKSSKAASANSAATPRELAPMTDQLTEPRPGFTGATQYPPGAVQPISISQNPTGVLGPSGNPIMGTPTVTPGAAPALSVASEQSPIDALGMKRQFDRDFIRNWNPAANTKGALGVARQAYGSMADELHKGVPGTAELDQRASSLIPVAERARLTDLGAGPIDRSINRLTRPTGGAVPLLFGLHEGGVPGAMATMAAQEALGSPTVKLMGARTLYNLGQGIQSQPMQRAAQAIPLVRNKEQ